jgi:stage V sporulation protein K
MENGPHRIQVVFPRMERVKRPETLAEQVKTTAPSNVAAAFEEMERLIGLDDAKKLMYEIHALLRINKERERHNLKLEKQVYHMVFKGNPGTGKTTVARLFGKIFREMGILSKGHLIEVERADLVGEFIGHTAQKTRELIKKAMGGILFIDEAYSLARGGEKDFGKEAIDCLTKALEDHGNDFICILAGYTDEMESFLELNPGLPSRFPIQLQFADYTVEELIKIAERIVQSKEYQLSPAAKQKLRNHLYKLRNDVFEANFSNARYVRNLIEKGIRLQAVRLLSVSELTREDLLTLQAEDFVWSTS